jgi:hypothetical protein
MTLSGHLSMPFFSLSILSELHLETGRLDREGDLRVLPFNSF